MSLISPLERMNQILADRPMPSPRIGPDGGLKLSGVPEAGKGPSFGETLKGVVESVNQQQVRSDELATRFTTGEVENVHDAMLAMEKASLSFQFLVEVRNKLVEGYQEVMRMQV